MDFRIIYYLPFKQNLFSEFQTVGGFTQPEAFWNHISLTAGKGEQCVHKRQYLYMQDLLCVTLKRPGVKFQ